MIRSKEQSCEYVLGDAVIEEVDALSMSDVKEPLCGQGDGWIKFSRPALSDLEFSSDSVTWTDELALLNLRAGSYPILIRSGRAACLEVATIELQSFNPFVGARLVFDQLDPSCGGAEDGMIGLSNTVQRIPDLVWSTGSNAPVISGLKADEYSVRVIDARMCYNTFDFVLTSPELEAFDFGVPEDVLICFGSSFQSALPPNDNGYYLEYNQRVAIIEDEVLNLEEAGEYRLYTRDDLGCEPSTIINVDVSEDELNAKFLLPSEGVVGEKIVAVELSWPIIPDSIFWEVSSGPDDIEFIDLNQLNLRFDVPGEYMVTMYAYHGDCMSSITKGITIVSDADGLSYGRNISNVPSVKLIELFPNPNAGKFQVLVELLNAAPTQIRIYDSHSGLVHHENAVEGSVHRKSFRLDNLEPGVYTLMVMTPTTWKSKNFVITR